MDKAERQPALPNFFILGAAKAGTTTVFALLNQLPEIYFPFAKETLFFSKDAEYNKGIPWYLQTYYPDAASFPLCGDATPHYLYWAEKVAPRLAEHFPTAPKFILLLRDPVERTYSWYWNMIREGRETLPFEQALKAEEERLHTHHTELFRQGSMIYGYVNGSHYAAQIRHYLTYFPRERFHFILNEDLRTNPETTMQDLLTFLGLPANQRQFSATTHNPASLPRSMSLQRWLHKQSSLRDRLKSVIPIQTRYAIKEKLIRLNLRATRYPPINPKTEARLRQQFDAELVQLQEIIERDLSAWRVK